LEDREAITMIRTKRRTTGGLVKKKTSESQVKQDKFPSVNHQEEAEIPWGREAVKEAVLKSATELFAARGYAAVSVRDIAQSAGVNHALVHRHFGTKQEVLKAALERTAGEFIAVAKEITDLRLDFKKLFAAAIEHAAYFRTLARITLEGENLAEFQRDFPTIKRMIELLDQRVNSIGKGTKRSGSSVDARVQVAALVGLTMGWVVFEDTLLIAAGLEQHDREEVRDEIVRIIQRLVNHRQ
jgi:AcrR family transcriptional regulator